MRCSEPACRDRSKGAPQRSPPAWTGARVIAVDVPSGVSGDGRVTGPAFSAAVTVTFAPEKAGRMSFYPGAGALRRHRARRYWIAGGGDPRGARKPLGENQPELWERDFPWPAVETHKHQRGRVAVASGGPSRTGAARLAARSALRAGAGAGHSALAAARDSCERRTPYGDHAGSRRGRKRTGHARPNGFDALVLWSRLRIGRCDAAGGGGGRGARRGARAGR